MIVGLIWVLIVGALVFLTPIEDGGNKITGYVTGQEVMSSFPELFRYEEWKNQNLLDALQIISYEFNEREVEVTPELLAAIVATLRMEVGGSFLPVSEYSFDYCPSYTGGCDYRGRGWIQITHKYNYAKHCGDECLLESGKTCKCAHKYGGCDENDVVEKGQLDVYIKECAPARALLPEYAGKTFASFYTSNGLVTLSNKGNYLKVGKLINGGDIYAKNFDEIANYELNKFNANPEETAALLDYLNDYKPKAKTENGGGDTGSDSGTGGLSPTVMPVQIPDNTLGVYSIKPVFETEIGYDINYYQELVQDAQRLLQDVKGCDPEDLYDCVSSKLPRDWQIVSNDENLFAFEVPSGEYMLGYDAEDGSTQKRELVYKFALYIKE